MAYGYGYYGFPHPAPPDPPELPEGASPFPRWPAWYAPVAFLAAFVATIIAVIPIGIVADAAGSDLEDAPPGLMLALILVQDAVFVGTALLFAAQKVRPKPWHFGLRRTRFWPTVGWAALGFAAFFLFQVLYSVLIQPEGEQSVAEDLGADESTVALVSGAFLVIVLAPFAEEFFFRGFFYRALRTRLNVWIAAVIDGIVFGAVHFTGTQTLSILPVLAGLGIVFCLVYERTGTLYAPIGLHAFNNTIAYAAVTDDGIGVAAAFGAAMLVACALLPRYSRDPTPALR
jgi:membrane protease YdiL (CAAX protease family)